MSSPAEAGAAATAIVTGAASGIGRHFATALRRQRPDMVLVLCDADEQRLAEAHGAAADVTLETFDIRDAGAWERVIAATVQRHGRLDYLFNIAGIDRIAMFVDQPLANIDDLVDVNLKGTLYGMRLAAAQMAAQGSGQIVNVASLAGISPTPGTAIYSATKFALRGVSLAAAVELRGRGVTVTVVCPDLVDTELLEQHLDRADPEAAALAFSGPRPLRPEEVTEAILRAMRDRPLEITIPLGRGLLAKLAGAAPSALVRLYQPLSRRGARSFERTRASRRR